MAVGMNSSVDFTNDLHVIFLDFDIEDVERVKESVRELQEFWNLAEAHIYKTMHGHHVVFYYDIIPYARVKMIIDYARYVDPMFKQISRHYNHKTIRASGKYAQRDIRYVCCVPGKRSPTPEEVDVGTLKAAEHKELMREWMQSK